MSKKFTITPERFKSILSVASSGGTLKEAAAAVGVSRSTLTRTLDREGLKSWREEHFPSRQGFGGGPGSGSRSYREHGGSQRWLKAADVAHLPLNVDRNLPHVKAATMKWRQAA